MRGDDVKRNPKRGSHRGPGARAASALVPGCRKTEEARAAQAAPAAPGPGRARGPALARGPGRGAGSPRRRPAPRSHLARGAPLCCRTSRPSTRPSPTASSGSPATRRTPRWPGRSTRSPSPTRWASTPPTTTPSSSRRSGSRSGPARASLPPTAPSSTSPSAPSSMRLLQSAHWGRVDPRLVGFDYDVTSKRLDLASAAPFRAGRGRAPRRDRRRRAAVPGLPPPREGPRRLPRARRGRRARAGAGSRRAAEEGRAGQALGGSARPRRAAARPRRPARGRPGARAGAGRHARLRRRARRRGEALPGPSRPRGRRRHRARHDRGAQRPRWPHRVHQIELALERERWLPETRKEPHVFVNVPLFRLWALRPRPAGRAASHERGGRQDARARDADLHRARWST